MSDENKVNGSTTSVNFNRYVTNAQGILKKNAVESGKISNQRFKNTRSAVANRLIKATELYESRLARENAKRDMVAQYTEMTQDVLNDKTLNFLVQHSNIAVPTFTSVVAGFELARASRADKGKELLNAETKRLDNLNNIDKEYYDRVGSLTDKHLGNITTQASEQQAIVNTTTNGMSDASRSDTNEAYKTEATKNANDFALFSKELDNQNNMNRFNAENLSKALNQGNGGSGKGGKTFMTNGVPNNSSNTDVVTDTTNPQGSVTPNVTPTPQGSVTPNVTPIPQIKGQSSSNFEEGVPYDYNKFKATVGENPTAQQQSVLNTLSAHPANRVMGIGGGVNLITDGGVDSDGKPTGAKLFSIGNDGVISTVSQETIDGVNNESRKLISMLNDSYNQGNVNFEDALGQLPTYRKGQLGKDVSKLKDYQNKTIEEIEQRRIKENIGNLGVSNQTPTNTNEGWEMESREIVDGLGVDSVEYSTLNASVVDGQPTDTTVKNPTPIVTSSTQPPTNTNLVDGVDEQGAYVLDENGKKIRFDGDA